MAALTDLPPVRTFSRAVVTRLRLTSAAIVRMLRPCAVKKRLRRTVGARSGDYNERVTLLGSEHHWPISVCNPACAAELRESAPRSYAATRE